MKFAFLVMHELRTLKYIDKLYQYIIDYYDADVFVCCQNMNNDDTDEQINLFKRRVVQKTYYEKPDPYAHFQNHSLLKAKSQNWNKSSCLQLYINWDKMATEIEHVYHQYDYFIMIRTDINILFPFPEPHLFEIAPKGIYTFDANYCREWGGYYCGVFVHRDFILQLLRCTHTTVMSENLCRQVPNLRWCNQEKFVNACMRKCGLTYKYISHINIIFVVNPVTRYTTWGEVLEHKKYKDDLIKYTGQVDEALNNLELWNNGYRWTVINDTICLALPTQINDFDT